MATMICEVCGSNEIVKEDEMFVCKGCGCKYTLEQAKKLVGAGNAESASDVSKTGGKANDLENLYTLARRARDSSDYANAENYYSKILLSKPDDWEATFYSMVSSAITKENLSETILRVSNGQAPVYDLVLKATDDKEERKKILHEIVQTLSDFTIACSDRAKGILKQYESHDSQLQYLRRTTTLRETMFECGDTIEKKFGEGYGECAAAAWKTGIAIKEKVDSNVPTRGGNEFENRINSYIAKCQKEDPSYTSPRASSSSSSGGCYVATCVYGSYDCAEVWTLRRYRDDTLAKTRRGRAFIRFYYAVSPTVVKLFGRQKWFRKAWKGILDKKVAKLQSQGVECTQYDDLPW